MFIGVVKLRAEVLPDKFFGLVYKVAVSWCKYLRIEKLEYKKLSFFQSSESFHC